MRFVPDYKLELITEDDFPEKIKTVGERLDACQNSGLFDTFDGKKIYCEYFLAENSRASVVIVHGLSEFTKKFYEIAYYLLNQGYNVFIYDQRCHGLSCRLTDQIDLLHVDNFRDYVNDLSDFIEKIVIPADDKPIYIYSHSMGGAVTALYLAEQGERVQKAVLSAPLFDPVVGSMPSRVARFLVGAARFFCGSRTKFMFSQEFDPDIPFDSGIDQSRARFLHNMELRRGDEHYQSTPMTLGWVHGSLKLRSTILKRSVAGSITTPILLLSSEKDRVVQNDAHLEFARICRSCRLVTVKNANHAMLTGGTDVLKEHIDQVLEFYGS